MGGHTAKTQPDFEQPPFDAAPPTKIWRVHPFREQPGRGIAALAMIAIFSVCAGVFANSFGAPVGEAIFWAILSFVLLFISLGNFFLSTRYAMDNAGISMINPLWKRRIRWTEVRRLAIDQRGGFLSSRAKPSRLDAFRGLNIRFGRDRDQRADIVRMIRQQLEEGPSSERENKSDHQVEKLPDHQDDQPASDAAHSAQPDAQNGPGEWDTKQGV